MSCCGVLTPFGAEAESDLTCEALLAPVTIGAGTMCCCGLPTPSAASEKGILLGGFDLGVTTMVGESNPEDAEGEGDTAAEKKTPSTWLFLLWVSCMTGIGPVGDGNCAPAGVGVGVGVGAGTEGMNWGLHRSCRRWASEPCCIRWFGLGEGASRKADMAGT